VDWADFAYTRSDEAVFSDRELKALSARFEVWNVLNSLKRGELALLSNFIRPAQLQNFRSWMRFLSKALATPP
jgi:uncharacterized protein with NRDE domain